MPDLYKRLDVDSKEPVQFVGFYVLKYKPELGAPDALFVEQDRFVIDIEETPYLYNMTSLKSGNEWDTSPNIAATTHMQISFSLVSRSGKQRVFKGVAEIGQLMMALVNAGIIEEKK